MEKENEVIDFDEFAFSLQQREKQYNLPLYELNIDDDLKVFQYQLLGIVESPDPRKRGEYVQLENNRIVNETGAIAIVSHLKLRLHKTFSTTTLEKNRIPVLMEDFMWDFAEWLFRNAKNFEFNSDHYKFVVFTASDLYEKVLRRSIDGFFTNKIHETTQVREVHTMNDSGQQDSGLGLFGMFKRR